MLLRQAKRCAVFGFACRKAIDAVLARLGDCGSVRSWLAASTLILAITICSAASRADEVDFAVDAFAAAGPGIGISLGTTEKNLAKSLVRCAAKGATPLNCAREELVKTLPKKAQPFAGCMLQGGSAEQCLRSAAIAQLPPNLQGLATCIARESDVVRCGKEFAVDQAQGAAFNAIDALKVDAGHELGKPVPGPLANIIGMVQGIKEDDWAKVVRHGGTEAAKVAGKALMRVFLGAEACGAAGPGGRCHHREPRGSCRAFVRCREKAG